MPICHIYRKAGATPSHGYKISREGLEKISEKYKINKIRHTVSFHLIIINMTFESQGAERKEIAIMRILSDSVETIGARVIAHHL